MPDPAGETSRLVDLLRLGNEEARNRLIAHVCERLRLLTNRMLRSYPSVRRREQTDDVLQNALIRLCRALEATKLESARHFYNLAALQIRRELLDLARRHLRPQSDESEGHSDGSGKRIGDAAAILHAQPSAVDEPGNLEEWTNFHEKVGFLPDEDREVFGLLWYDELAQDEVAEVLGVSVRTVKRRWQAARLKLAQALRRPGEES
jgi:RNA polymerase sigma factor (sigma-70 family)